MADGIMNKDQLLSLTLRQLRQEASKLSVPLYSRKTKAVLVDLILKYQEKSTKKIIHFQIFLKCQLIFFFFKFYYLNLLTTQQKYIFSSGSAK